jgi:hypothetical protein
MGQVKSDIWTGSSAAATSATGTFAAGFKSMLSISSSSSTTGDPLGAGGSSGVLALVPSLLLLLAVAVANLVDADVVAAVVPSFNSVNVLTLSRLILLLRVARRVQRRWGASSSAIRVFAIIAARRVDRLAIAGEVAAVVPIEKDGVTMIDYLFFFSRRII